jgi:hypothetical protein
MATVIKIPRQVAPTVGQHAVTTRVKFQSGSPSTLGKKFTSGLVWRFGTIDCVSDNLDYFEDSFSDSGSFLDVGSHRFYIAKLFPEEVTNVSAPLCDAGLSCSESIDLGAMVEVLALGTKRATIHRAPRARRSNAFFHRSKSLRSQSRTPRTSTSWTCAHHSTTPSTPLRPQRPWSKRASPSSARRPMLKTPDAM